MCKRGANKKQTNELRYCIFQCSNLSKMYRSMPKKLGRMTQVNANINVLPLFATTDSRTNSDSAPRWLLSGCLLYWHVFCRSRRVQVVYPSRVLTRLVFIADQEARCEKMNTSSALLVLTFARSFALAQPNATTVY